MVSQFFRWQFEWFLLKDQALEIVKAHNRMVYAPIGPVSLSEWWEKHE